MAGRKALNLVMEVRPFPPEPSPYGVMVTRIFGKDKIPVQFWIGAP
jgi:hypothetical protein